jgi:uncharacterized surface protein with fasciclin (FAS1) repeats
MTQATLLNFIGANTSVSLSMLIQDTGLLVGSEERCEVKVAVSNSFGYTVFAPMDSTFDSIKAGTLNTLMQREQVTISI